MYIYTIHCIDNIYIYIFIHIVLYTYYLYIIHIVFIYIYTHIFAYMYTIYVSFGHLEHDLRLVNDD